ncbi:MAG: AAA-ATPase-like domain-containing protein [Candidatus Midichloria mitochondrii]|nr:AAA family ATPase [Candidatus Midichloria mitochondrii]MDJ1288625.1 AAA family ATPase [Candidatus Midichloria mitochondrii]
MIESDKEAILIIRPRRWGKSLNFDMLKKFFNIEVDQYGNKVEHNSNRVLFAGGEAVLADGRTLSNLSLTLRSMPVSLFFHEIILG